MTRRRQNQEDPQSVATPREAPEPRILELSVVMPCLDEAATLGACVEKAQRVLSDHHIEGEIIVADNGSSDGSQAIAARMGARVVRVPDRGYGSALRGGINAARGRYIIIADADASHDLAQIPALLARLREGFDLVVGNRFQGDIKSGAMPPLHRYLGNPALKQIAKLFFRSPCGDQQCGFRGFSRQAFSRMKLRATGMEFASEMVIKATALRMRIAEVPTTVFPSGRQRAPHLRTWHDGWRHLRLMLLHSPRWLFLYPGGALMIAGFLACLWLIPGPRTVHGVTFDIHTLLYAATAVLLGFQSITLAAFTKVYAIRQGILPNDPRWDRVLRALSLEVGLIIGTILIMLGLAASVYEVSSWGAQHWGDLQPVKTMRLIIPAVSALALGGEIILASFFLSVLLLGEQSERPPAPRTEPQ